MPGRGGRRPERESVAALHSGGAAAEAAIAAHQPTNWTLKTAAARRQNYTAKEIEKKYRFACLLPGREQEPTSTPSLCHSGSGKPLGCGWEAAFASEPSAPCCWPMDGGAPCAEAAAGWLLLCWSKGLAAKAAAAAMVGAGAERRGGWVTRPCRGAAALVPLNSQSLSVVAGREAGWLRWEWASGACSGEQERQAGAPGQ